MGPSHCDLSGNERTDQVAKEAAELPQEQVPVDVTTNCRAVARTAREQTIEHWPPGWLQRLMGGTHSAAGNRARPAERHPSTSFSCVQATGRSSGPTCTGSGGTRQATVRVVTTTGCPAMLCPICREEPDRPDHIALRCPALMRIRYRETGTTNPTEEEVRGTAGTDASRAWRLRPTNVGRGEHQQQRGAHVQMRSTSGLCKAHRMGP